MATEKEKMSVADLEISWEYIVYVFPSLAIQRLLAFQCWMLPSAWHVVDSLEMNYRGKVKWGLEYGENKF